MWWIQFSGVFSSVTLHHDVNTSAVWTTSLWKAMKVKQHLPTCVKWVILRRNPQHTWFITHRDSSETQQQTLTEAFQRSKNLPPNTEKFIKSPLKVHEFMASDHQTLCCEKHWISSFDDLYGAKAQPLKIKVVALFFISISKTLHEETDWNLTKIWIRTSPVFNPNLQTQDCVTLLHINRLYWWAHTSQTWHFIHTRTRSLHTHTVKLQHEQKPWSLEGVLSLRSTASQHEAEI